MKSRKMFEAMELAPQLISMFRLLPNLCFGTVLCLALAQSLPAEKKIQLVEGPISVLYRMDGRVVARIPNVEFNDAGANRLWGKRGDGQALFRADGTRITAFDFEAVDRFSGGFARVRMKESRLSGCLDSNGRLATPPDMEELSGSCENGTYSSRGMYGVLYSEDGKIRRSQAVDRGQDVMTLSPGLYALYREGAWRLFHGSRSVGILRDSGSFKQSGWLGETVRIEHGSFWWDSANRRLVSLPGNPLASAGSGMYVFQEQSGFRLLDMNRGHEITGDWHAVYRVSEDSFVGDLGSCRCEDLHAGTKGWEREDRSCRFSDLRRAPVAGAPTRCVDQFYARIADAGNRPVTYVWDFIDGAAIVAFGPPANRRYGLIDEEGHLRLSAKFAEISGTGSVFRARLPEGEGRGLWRLYDRQGNPLATDLIVAGELSGGRIAVAPRRSSSDEVLYGYLDSSGRMVIPPRFSEAERFEEARAIVARNSRHGVIDRTGRVIIPLRYESIRRIRLGKQDYAFLVRTKKNAGVIDREGRIIVPLIYRDVRGMEGGLLVGLLGEPGPAQLPGP